MQKKKSSLRPPSLLLWKMAFEFDTPMTVEQCLSKLELMKEIEGSSGSEHVELITRSEQRLQFKIEDDRSRLGTGWTLGEVQSFDDRPYSRFSGTIGITTGVGFYVPLVLGSFICPILLATQLISGLSFIPLAVIPVMIAVLYGLFFFLALRLRRNLYEDLKHLFSADQKATPTAFSDAAPDHDQAQPPPSESSRSAGQNSA